MWTEGTLYLGVCEWCGRGKVLSSEMLGQWEGRCSSFDGQNVLIFVSKRTGYSVARYWGGF
jgi:hypothetical protein